MDAITALIGVIAGTLKLDPSELTSSLKSGDDFKSGKEIESYLNPLFTTKFEGLVPSAKVEQARGKALKDAYTEVEGKIKTTLGVEGKLNEDLLDKVKEALTKTAKGGGGAAAPDYENSETHKKLVRDHKKEIKTLKSNHATALKAEIDARVDDVLIAETVSYLSDAKNKFVLPKSKSILDKQARLIVNDIKAYEYDGAPVQLSVDPTTRKPVIKDKDGDPLKDKQMNDLGLFDIVDSVTTGGYFPKMEGSGKKTPTTTPAGGGSTTSVKFGKEGSETTLDIPAFQSKSEMVNYLVGEEGSKLTPQGRDAIRTAYSGKFEE